jgi:hypothetical protein
MFYDTGNGSGGSASLGYLCSTMFRISMFALTSGWLI